MFTYYFHRFYVLKCVPLRSICWSPNSQYLKMWLYLEIASLKQVVSLNKAIWVTSNPNRLYRKRGWGHTKSTRDMRAQSQDHVRARWEGDHLASQGKKPQKTPNLMTLWYWTLLWQPQQTNLISDRKMPMF